MTALPATIKDVASQAGVSVATASRALSGYRHVSAKARQQVLAAAELLGYKPDQIARSLRTRRTNLIGLVISTIENVFFTEVARAAEQAAHARGYNLIVCNTDEDPEREKSCLSVLDRLLVAGVILASAPRSAAHLTPFVKGKLPIVLINRRVDDLNLPSITCNDSAASFACVQQLIGEGRGRIAAITGLPEVSTTHERLEGYRSALQQAGLPLDPTLEVCGKANLEGSYRAVCELMRLKTPPDALFVFNNLMTQGAVMALQDLGISWPDPVDVAGFGAFQAARLYQPPLTLIEQPTHTMGERAVAMLIDQVEGREDGQDMQHIVLDNRLIPRDAWLQARLRQVAPSIN